ncbi:DUF4350 domain-containing protein [Streptomyces bambusae]|uniref:DUF4350 domain-containing protein n=1 Tax=Streptomyces bambusae TaxID=1550616 RepID=UPI001CFF63CD|nr:DUF4350 domain-containing protein [Streptomyces bambusae]MCB5169435.1 DUF4350 domain-containing protein [Streptomyces bambusae]
MTAPGTLAPPAAGPGTSLALGPRRQWRRARGLLLALAVLLIAGFVLAVLNSGDHHGRLDPRSADRQGSRAVAELLADRGVTTRVVTTTREAAAAAAPDATLLVTDPGLLGTGQLAALKTSMDLSGGRTVLLAPGGPALEALAPGVTARPPAGPDVLGPGCTLPAATTAGRAETGGGLRYATTLPGALSCYRTAGAATVLTLPRPGAATGDTVLLGAPTPLLNERLAEEGNASLALQLLGSRPTLVWYLPSLDDPALTEDPAADRSFFDLIPDGWSWALLQLAVAAALAALWRARRLGPLVTEQLPVAVRASEAAEGRARLYHAAGARDRAADVLRTATRTRLAALVGVPAARAHDPAVLLPAVAAVTGRDPAALLFGTAPGDDAALVALADHLDALEREVRTS